MSPIIVPNVPLTYKILAGIPLLICAFLALYCGWKNLGLSIRTLQGKVPLPAGSRPALAVVGAAFWFGALTAGLGATWFFLALETAQPTTISDDGIAWITGPPYYEQKFIRWHEVTKVTCGIPWFQNTVKRIKIYYSDSVVELGAAGMALEGVLATVRSRVPQTVVRPCTRERF